MVVEEKSMSGAKGVSFLFLAFLNFSVLLQSLFFMILFSSSGEAREREREGESSQWISGNCILHS